MFSFKNILSLNKIFKKIYNHQKHGKTNNHNIKKFKTNMKRTLEWKFFHNRPKKAKK